MFIVTPIIYTNTVQCLLMVQIPERGTTQGAPPGGGNHLREIPYDTIYDAP